MEDIKIAIYTNRVKIGIARLKISKLLSIHIAIQSLQHILLSNFKFLKLRNMNLRWKYGIKQGILRVYFRAAI